MGSNVAFNILPIVMVITNLFAVTTNWDNSLQSFYLLYSFLELDDPVGQLCLQLNHTYAYLYTYAQFLTMIGFGQIVVSTCLHTLDDFLCSLSCCKQNNIRRY